MCLFHTRGQSFDDLTLAGQRQTPRGATGRPAFPAVCRGFRAGAAGQGWSPYICHHPPCKAPPAPTQPLAMARTQGSPLNPAHALATRSGLARGEVEPQLRHLCPMGGVGLNGGGDGPACRVLWVSVGGPGTQQTACWTPLVGLHRRPCVRPPRVPCLEGFPEPSRSLGPPHASAFISPPRLPSVGLWRCSSSQPH